MLNKDLRLDIDQLHRDFAQLDANVMSMETEQRRIIGREVKLHRLEMQINRLDKKLDALVEATGVTPVEEQVIPFHYVDGESA